MSVLSLDRKRLGANPFAWRLVAQDIIKAVRRQRPGVIHAHGIRAGVATALATRFHRGPALVVTVHGLHSLRRAHPALHGVIAWANRRVLRSFDRVIVLGPSDRATVLERRLARPEAIRLILPGVALPPDRRGGTPRDRRGVVVLWAGRFVAQKDPLVFIEAAGRSSDTDVSWIMAGDGELLEGCRADAPPSLTFVGWQTNLESLLNTSDVFVSTSRWEGFPLALVEAALAGLTIVATDVPGNQDLVSIGVPIELVPQGDASALARVIQGFVRDPVERERRGLETATAARRIFSIDRMIEETRAVYLSLTPEGSRSASG